MNRLFPLLLLASASCSAEAVSSPQPVYPATSKITIDGKAQEKDWQHADWYALDHHIIGDMPTSEDFSGRYKLLWDEDYLYLLAEITDDVLIDTHPDPKDAYWDDDCLEIFIDEDASGGNHLYSFNAFAYHIALDGNVADFGNAQNDNSVILLNDHVTSKWTRQTESPYRIVWEVAVKLYPDTFNTASPGDPVNLKANKIIGFMLAYCDNDGSDTREHFIGSHAIEPVNGDKNRGYIDASVFGKLELKPKTAW
ncbi:sugar-binding protein [Salinimonas chungwhensis]|uniref:sugar-binding protein n=1 Tax=Salinimonas chungwhensis TaxID=265425 RepID=UPI0003A4388F|nr:sugar-binding protein [Salinimonas chungwhensis]